MYLFSQPTYGQVLSVKRQRNHLSNDGVIIFTPGLELNTIICLQQREAGALSSTVSNLQTGLIYTSSNAGVPRAAIQH